MTTRPTADPPYDVRTVLAIARDSLIGGSSGWITIPAGASLGCQWLPRKGCYRVTIDVRAGRELGDEAKVAEYVADTRASLPPVPLEVPR